LLRLSLSLSLISDPASTRREGSRWIPRLHAPVHALRVARRLHLRVPALVCVCVKARRRRS
jgi:hypothetical protein